MNNVIKQYPKVNLKEYLGKAVPSDLRLWFPFQEIFLSAEPTSSLVERSLLQGRPT